MIIGNFITIPSMPPLAVFLIDNGQMTMDNYWSNVYYIDLLCDMFVLWQMIQSYSRERGVYGITFLRGGRFSN